MAYLHQGPKPDGGSFYNVEQAVGATGANATGDVKLVQYMLAHLYGAEAAALRIDGWIGPVTIGWIRRFQTDARAGGANVLVDGRVDRAFATVSSISKTTYTVLLLNRALRLKNPAAHAGLPKAVPLSLKPRANPYNPRPAVPDSRARVVIAREYRRDSHGCTVRVYYEDHSVDELRVSGAIRETGSPHGKVVAAWSFAMRFVIVYEDGYTEVHSYERIAGPA